MQIFILPSVHVSKKNTEIVEGAVRVLSPNTIAVELCQPRFLALAQKKKPGLFDALRSPLYGLLYLAQQTIGVLVGAKPGLEMVAALEASANHKIPLLLADLPITQTLNCIKKIPLSEKIALFLPTKLPIQISLSNMDSFSKPENLSKILELFKKSTPSLYKCAIEDRNSHMLSTIIAHGGEKTLLVTGAGHAPGLCALIDRANLHSQKQITYKIIQTNTS